MALFESKRKKELQEQEKEVFQNPSPKALASLISQYIAAGNLDQALEVGKRAMSLFPESEAVITAYQNLKRMKLDTRMMVLHKEIQSRPDRSHYEALASIYFTDLNNRSKAFEVAQDALQKFPESDGLHLICGLIRMERFHKDYLANDFREALSHFEHASETNPMNYRALLSLGRMYAEIGLYSEARHVFDKLLQFCPSDEFVDKVLAIMESHSAESRAIASLDDTLSELERRRALDSVGESIREIFEPTREVMVRKINAVQIDDFMKGLDDSPGFQSAVILGHDGGPVTSRFLKEDDGEVFQKAVHIISGSCADSSRRMDIGGFTSAEVQSPHGTVLIVHTRGYVLGYRTSKTLRTEDTSNITEKFIAAIASF